MNKNAMSMAIVVLVLLTLILVVLTITYFITSKKIDVETLKVSESIETTYRAARYFEYELNIVFLRACKDFKFEDGKSKFIERFNGELNKHDGLITKQIFLDITNNEFYIDYTQVNENNINLSPEKITLTLDLNITNKTALSEGLLGVKYNYKKTFEKKF